MDAKDKYDVSPVFKHKGYNIQGNLFWKNKVGVALNYGFYDYKTDNPLRPGGQAGRQIKDTTLHVSYMFRPNVRIAGEYTSTSQKGGSSSYSSSSYRKIFHRTRFRRQGDYKLPCEPQENIPRTYYVRILLIPTP